MSWLAILPAFFVVVRIPDQFPLTMDDRKKEEAMTMNALQERLADLPPNTPMPPELRMD